jgi:hypothetical protein
MAGLARTTKFPFAIPVLRKIEKKEQEEKEGRRGRKTLK